MQLAHQVEPHRFLGETKWDWQVLLIQSTLPPDTSVVDFAATVAFRAVLMQGAGPASSAWRHVQPLGWPPVLRQAGAFAGRHPGIPR